MEIHKEVIKVYISDKGFAAEKPPLSLYNLTKSKWMKVEKLADYHRHELRFVFDEKVSDGLQKHLTNLFDDIIAENLDQRSLLDLLH